MFGIYKKKRLAVTTVVYWFLLCYIVAALAWWYIELWNLNEANFAIKEGMLNPSANDYRQQLDNLLSQRSRKIAQFASEGITFLAVTIVAAIFVYRSVKKQITLNAQQQNFMMAVTHELKTPIAVTKLNLETLRRHRLDTTQVDNIIGKTLEETNRLNDLCNNILLSSQLEAGSFQLTSEKLSLNDVVNESAGEFARRFQKRDIRKVMNEELYVSGDSLMLRLAINNLLENALKYSQPAAAVEIRTARNGNNCVIEVADTGSGIPDAEKKKIFDKFYRIGNENTRNTKGTGLGLYLTRKIIEDHGGSIYVRDNQPSGVVFVIEIPEINHER
ncbi:sensor histidine kinase [Pollutibacter soli]|uniref:sensor histidine kinase n=1 Tax=Pollutibacter soli TaxID=3034157 RepID=UPI0030141D7E